MEKKVEFRISGAFLQLLYAAIGLGMFGLFMLSLVTNPTRAVALAVFMVALGVNKPERKAD